MKLCDKNGKPIEKFEFVDPENPLLLIDPVVGGKYECTVYVKNTSEWSVLHIRLTHNYEDLRIEPSYVASLRSKKTVKIRIFWRPFTEKGLSEKIRDHKIFVNIENRCVVETIAEIPEEV